MNDLIGDLPAIGGRLLQALDAWSREVERDRVRP